MTRTSYVLYQADLLDPKERRALVRRNWSFRSRVAPEKWRFARQMRRNPTDPERVLWQELRKQKILGAKFRRQTPILGWIADFYCPEIRLVVEVDGPDHERPHRQRADWYRNGVMVRAGFSVVRIANDQLAANLAQVISNLRMAIDYCRTGQLRNP
jgi:very-short-patch-repair endonuclease